MAVCGLIQEESRKQLLAAPGDRSRRRWRGRVDPDRPPLLAPPLLERKEWVCNKFHPSPRLRVLRGLRLTGDNKAALTTKRPLARVPDTRTTLRGQILEGPGHIKTKVSCRRRRGEADQGLTPEHQGGRPLPEHRPIRAGARLPSGSLCLGSVATRGRSLAPLARKKTLNFSLQ